MAESKKTKEPQKTKIKAPGPNTSRQIYRETMETVTDFIYLFIWTP